jgi:putative addiction module CopG family antidote
MSIDIPAEFMPFVQSAVASGRYPSESAVVEAALKRLRHAHEELQQAIKEGFDQIERGECFEIANEAELREFFEGIKREAQSELEARAKSQ